MNSELARTAMICLGGVIGAAILAAAVVSSLVAWKAPQQATGALLGLVEGGNSIRLLTTFGVIIAACFLALSSTLTEGAIALLSSVAGFMLGGMRPRGLAGSGHNAAEVKERDE